MKRYCIVEDSNGDRRICPAEKKQEVEASIDAVEVFWDNLDDEEERPEDLSENLPLWEGEALTFSDPQINGKPIFKEES